jgi:hypothetical protein
MRRLEEAAGLARHGTYRSFAEQVRETKRAARVPDRRQAEGQAIAGYGAPGKGNTLLNYCGIRTDFLDYTVDRNPYKHGRSCPAPTSRSSRPERIDRDPSGLRAHPALEPEGRDHEAARPRPRTGAGSSSCRSPRAYAQCKVNVERDVKPLASPDFCVTFLRNATAYGPSPRMRFDIVLNDLCALAWTRKKIAMISDGSPWRPIVHIEDIIEAMRCALEAPADAVNGEVFNVGSTAENYRVREIAQIVSEAFPGCEVSVGPPSADNRSYRVSFAKIESRLPGFKARWTARKGAEELRRLFERIEFSPQSYEFRAFTRLKQLKYLQQTGQIDQDLYWRAA